MNDKMTIILFSGELDKTTAAFILATTAALILITVSWGLQGLFILGIIAACAYLMNKFIKNKIGGITGDTLGASCELNELIVLFSIFILQNFIPKICY